MSTVLDLAKWDAVLDSDALLSNASRRLMWTGVTLDGGRVHPYGLGWELGQFRGQTWVHHSGETRGFRAEFARFLEQRVSVIVLMNLDDVDLGTIVSGVAGISLR